jgi:hypothetical protein
MKRDKYHRCEDRSACCWKRVYAHCEGFMSAFDPLCWRRSLVPSEVVAPIPRALALAPRVLLPALVDVEERMGVRVVVWRARTVTPVLEPG